MLKTSDEDLFDKIYDSLKENKLHICLVQSDKPNTALEFMSCKAGLDKKFSTVCHNNTERYGGYIFNVAYNTEAESNDKLTLLRHVSLRTVFNRWTEFGFNKHNDKDVLASSDFMAYIRSIGYTDADYVVVAIGM